MARPYALLRAGFPYLKTIGMRRNTNYPVDLAIGTQGRVYVLCHEEGSYNTRIARITLDDEFLGAIGGVGKGDGQFIWPTGILLDREENLFVLLAVGGLAVQFGLQAMINMASSLHMVPTKGMTLPFISYGGSSLLALGIGMGMLLALTRRRRDMEGLSS